MPQGAVSSSIGLVLSYSLPPHAKGVGGLPSLWGRAFSPVAVGPEGHLDFWGAAKPQALQQGGWGSVGHMVMLEGPGDNGIYAEGVWQSSRQMH